MKRTIEIDDAQYAKLRDLYKKATSVVYGKPDEYQMHQNNLTRHISEFIIVNYDQQILNENIQKVLNNEI